MISRLHTRSNYHPEKKGTNEEWSVEVRDGKSLMTLFDQSAYTWRHIGNFKTLEEAEEVAKHYGSSSGKSSVTYEGIYENGKRKGMTDFEGKRKSFGDPKEIVEKKFGDYSPERDHHAADDVQYDTTYIRKVKRNSRGPSK